MEDGPEKDDLVAKSVSTSLNYKERLEKIRRRDAIDSKFGYVKINDSELRDAWLVNFQPSEVLDDQHNRLVAAVDFYFLREDGSRFKVAYPYFPYLLLETVEGFDIILASHLTKVYDFCWVEHIEKVNLDLNNHLAGLKTKYLKVSFPSEVEHQKFKQALLRTILKNKEKLKSTTEYTTLLQKHFGTSNREDRDLIDYIIDIREYDLPYHMRVCVDNKIFAGLWYTVQCLNPETQKPSIVRNTDRVEPIEPVVCAYDIETTKAPLKFPDAEVDQIMMISYMINGLGYLIINRECVSADIDNFEYTPKPEFPGEFTVYNMANEKATIQKFFDHLLKAKPSVMVTYNGDFFDWPFVDKRAEFHGLHLADLGFYKDDQDEYKHAAVVHMDAFRWVKRDSYLPMGSQNLKAAARAKLRYDPDEVDPEMMVQMALDEPQKMANYSVSDAVATYYLYMKYVHPFVFALCTIIPLGPDDVLRKGSGTLCEALLMVEAFHNNIVFPNKQVAKDHPMTPDGFLMNSETYVGAKVEALESGVFKADIDCKFRIDVEVLEQLKSEVEATMRHAVVGELGVPLEEVTNFEEVCDSVKDVIDHLIQHPNRYEPPKIYHLDVGAMYPNIILTNRLQPPAVVTDSECMSCIYNTPEAKCKREMEWVWRGDLITATKGEYEGLIMQLEQERFGKTQVPFYSLPKDQRQAIEKKRIEEYCRRAHGKIHTAREEKRTTRICQRENSFYVDTVRAFRDRRYDYKAMLKKAKNQLSALDEKDVAGQKAAQARVVLFESLQLAHKCILNSFYGYVMRKGSRWFSMEMAGIVCYTGVQIITEARKLIERIGRPLELDTDGIWCLIPSSFPENFSFKTKSGKKLTVSYPGAMLNALVQQKFTNDQYHVLQPDGSFEIKSENSIFFEVDGPYLAMILPASTEEGKKLKKRYAVFNFDESLAELKGFEVKRRGELGIIKQFQTTIFKTFLKGTTLQEIYANVAQEADYWIDILESKGEALTDGQLFELIAENRSMSRKLEDYGAQKSTSITTAKRLVEVRIYF
uniref:DNA polymerase epsilon catalytic subunit n=1 Tax=Bursaphelenchus xylophilus TaxID=6326 RepID=A0A1I7SFS8_BURXY